MDEVTINLPCGFETTFGKLKNCDNIIRCMMCEEEELNVDSVLNLPANQVRLKEKKIEAKRAKELETIMESKKFEKIFP